MSDTIIGQDRYTISTPVEVRRGSTVVLRRQCFTVNHDTFAESVLDISGATAIRWDVQADLDDVTVNILTKTLAAGGIALVSSGTNGILDITLTAANTKTLTPGQYKASLAVTTSSGFYKFKPYHFTILAAPAIGEA